jgi:hypothetical protein
MWRKEELSRSLAEGGGIVPDHVVSPGVAADFRSNCLGEEIRREPIMD